jgi:hypothetical protein
MVIPIVDHGLDHMVGVVEDHHLDHVEDIHVLVEDDQDHVPKDALDLGKDIEVEIDVQEIEKDHGPGKSQGLEIENANHQEIDEDQDLNLSLDVAQDLEVIKKIRNILLNEKKINQKNEKKKKKRKRIPHLLYQKLRKKINLLRLIKRNLGQQHHPEVILEAQDHQVNHQGEVVRLVEERHLNQSKAVRLVILDVHCLQNDLGQELLFVNELADLLVEVEHLKNVLGNQIHLKDELENVVQVVISHVHLLKKDIDVPVHLYVDLHLPDHLLLEELLELHLKVLSPLLDLYPGHHQLGVREVHLTTEKEVNQQVEKEACQ